MAENETNEEYQFTELDPLNPNSFNEGGEVNETETAYTKKTTTSTSNVRRNAIIAVGVFVLAMLLYKIIGSFFVEKKLPPKQIPSLEMTTPTPTEEQAQPSVVEPPPPVTATPVPTPASSSTNEVSPDVSAKLSTLESNQENLGSQVSTFNGQLETVNTTLQSLTDKINEMNQTISTLSTKLEEQTHRVELMVKPVPVAKVTRVKILRRMLTYRIQAVIPGRAWLIASNGSTVTVRAGSRLPGYGVVRGIDVSLGRVTTSSGKIIRFGPNDS